MVKVWRGNEMTDEYLKHCLNDSSVLVVLTMAMAIGAAAYAATIRLGLTFALPFALCVAATVPILALH